MTSNVLSTGKTREQMGELLFYTFLLSMFSAKGLGLYDGQLIYKVIFVISLFFIWIKVIISEYTLSELIFVVTLGILSVIINRISGEKGPLILVAIVVGMQGIKLKRAMLLGGIGLGLGFVVNSVAYMLRAHYVDALWRENRLGIVRSFAWDMGQPHPNTTSAVYLAIVAMLVIIIGERYNFKHLIALSVGNMLLYLYCTSNTGVIVCEVLIILSFLAVRIRDFSRLGYFCINITYPFFILFSIIFPSVIPSGLLKYLDNQHHTLYSRIMLAREFVTIENLSLFGVNVSTITDSQYTLDNSMLYCIVFNGLICSVVISIGYIFFISCYVKEKRNLELIITVCFLLEGIFEPLLFNTSFKNITLFFLGECVWSYCLKKRNADCKLICVARFLRETDKIKFKVDYLYNKIIGAIDKAIANIEGEHTFVISHVIGSCVIALVITVIVYYLWPVTEDIFKPSSMYEVLVQYNELDKGLALEAMRRSVFVFLMSFGTIYLLLTSTLKEFVNRK